MIEFLPIFIFGAVVGSFLNVCILRLPKDESLVSPSSHCRRCKTPIAFYDNIPLISYLLLKGRCRSCNEAISARYFFIELLTGLLASALFFQFGFSLTFFVGFVFATALIVISFIDLDVRIVPDVISLPGIGVGFAFSVLGYFFIGDSLTIIPSPLSALLGIIVGGGFLLLVAWAYEYFTGVEGMGGGDIKLLAMIGAFLGWPSIPVTLFFASLAGSIIGLTIMLIKGVDSKYALPFAPFLCVGALLHLFFGEKILQIYLPVG